MMNKFKLNKLSLQSSLSRSGTPNIHLSLHLPKLRRKEMETYGLVQHLVGLRKAISVVQRFQVCLLKSYGCPKRNFAPTVFYINIFHLLLVLLVVLKKHTCPAKLVWFDETCCSTTVLQQWIPCCILQYWHQRAWCPSRFLSYGLPGDAILHMSSVPKITRRMCSVPSIASKHCGIFDVSIQGGFRKCYKTLLFIWRTKH